MKKLKRFQNMNYHRDYISNKFLCEKEVKEYNDIFKNGTEFLDLTQTKSLQPVKLYWDNAKTWFWYKRWKKISVDECAVKYEVVDNKEDADIVILDTYINWKPSYFSGYKNKLKKGQKMCIASCENPWHRNTNQIRDLFSAGVDYILHYSAFSDAFFMCSSFGVNYSYYKGSLKRYKFNISGIELTSNQMISKKYYDIIFKNKDKNYLAAASYSNCANYRKMYYKILGKNGIKIVNFGKCKEEKNIFIKGTMLNLFGEIPKYKFFLCFENTISTFYRSEKLYYGLMIKYSIPVYYGDPEIINFFFIKGILDKYKVFIFANDYDPVDLAKYLLYLDRNDTAYMEYFHWRFDGINIFVDNFYYPSNSNLLLSDKKMKDLRKFSDLSTGVEEGLRNITPFCLLAEKFRLKRKVCRFKYAKRDLLTPF